MFVELRDDNSRTSSLVTCAERCLEVCYLSNQATEILQPSEATSVQTAINRAGKGFTQDNNYQTQQQETCVDWGEYVTEGTAMYSSSNSTLNCKNVPRGETYWVSFKEQSFSRGPQFKVYSGLINGNGPRSRDKCVVKVFAEDPRTEEMCACEVKKCQKAKDLAREFNILLRARNTRVKFSYLFWAQIDEVSFMKNIFFSGKRRLMTKDVVLIEDDLRRDDDQPGKKRELTMYMDSLGKKWTCVAKDLEAFAHFTFHHSGGQLVVCDLEGVQDTEGFYLKTPVVHSRRKEYGKSDMGLQGIIEVFNNHVCNELCKDMIKPGEVLDNFHVHSLNNRQDTTDWSRTVSCTNHNLCPEYGRLVAQDSCNNNFFRPQSYSLFPSCAHPESRVEGSRSISGSATMSGYLEPSAPLEEDCVDEMPSSYMPHTRHDFVANWILQEHVPNNFITSRLFPPSQHLTRCGSLDNSVHINAGVSQETGTGVQARADSENANMAKSGLCSKNLTDNHDGSNNTTTELCNNEHASASLSTGFWSSASSSIPYSCTMTSGRCNNCQIHSPFTQNPATSFSHSDSQVVNPFGLPYVNTRDRTTAALGMARYQHVFSNSDHQLMESPPPYRDSQ